MGVNVVRNILIGPIIGERVIVDKNDPNKNIREKQCVGIIQLINKKNNAEIQDTDVTELAALLPALSEIIKTANEALKVATTSVSLALKMDNIIRSVTAKKQLIDEFDCSILKGTIAAVSENIKELQQGRKEYTFSDSATVNEVFEGLRGEEKRKKRKEMIAQQ